MKSKQPLVFILLNLQAFSTKSVRESARIDPRYSIEMKNLGRRSAILLASCSVCGSDQNLLRS